MLQLNSFNPLSSISKISTHLLSTYLLKGLMASALLILSFISVSAHAASSDSTSLITRAEAANPANFKFIRVNGRMVSDVIESCPIRSGLIACALKKLELINGRNGGVDDDYDLAQTFLFPSESQPRAAVVVITRSGLMDDSVNAERYRISFELKQNQRSHPGWHWVQYGEQFQCARGSTAGQWTKNLCP